MSGWPSLSDRDELFHVSSCLLHRSLDAVQQDGALSSQLPLAILASTPRLRHGPPEPFSFFGLLGSFFLRPFVGGAAFLGFSLFTLSSALFFCKGYDFLTATVVDV